MMYRTAVAAMMALATFSALAVDYNFSYRSTGDSGVKPLQVFDDGVRTYFQFPDRIGNNVPAILMSFGDGQRMAVPVKHGPYWVVDGVATAYVLRIRNVQAEVRSADHRGPLAPDRAQQFGDYGVVDPVLGGSTTTAQPISSPADGRFAVNFEVNQAELSKDAKSAIAKAVRAGEGEIVVVRILGRDDEAYGEGVAMMRAKAIRTEVMRHGISGDRIQIAEGAPRTGEAAKGNKFRASDLVIERQYPDPAVRAALIQQASVPASRIAKADGSAAQAVQAALQKINEGLQVLVTHGAIDSSTSAALSQKLASLTQKMLAQRPATVAEPAVPKAKTWVIQAGESSLREGLEVWAEQAGYDVKWEARVDYPVKETIVASGSFSAASMQALALTKSARVQLVGHVDNGVLFVRSKQ